MTGAWGKKAQEEAKKFLTVNVAAKGDNVSIPDQARALAGSASTLRLWLHAIVRGQGSMQ